MIGDWIEGIIAAKPEKQKLEKEKSWDMSRKLRESMFQGRRNDQIRWTQLEI